jgi:hypothetical protein
MGLGFGYGNYVAAGSNKSTAEQWLADIQVLNSNLHLSAKTGRTLPVNPASPQDLATKLMGIQRICNNAQLKQRASKQRFHERGGLRRKRLKSERWRARFLVQFREVIHRVKKLAKQGW